MYNHSSNSSCTLESWPLRIFYSQKSATNAMLFHGQKVWPKTNNSLMRMGNYFSVKKRLQCPLPASTVDSNPKIVTNLQGWKCISVSSCGGRSSAPLLFNCVCWYWYCRSVCIQSRGLQALLRIPSKLVD